MIRNQQKKELSVIIPNYNHSRFLPHALQAIVDQDYKDLEIIIIDDCSTDNSWSLLTEYQKKYNFIRLYRNSRNMGPLFCANKAIDLAEGEFLALSAADDKILPGFFSKTITLLKKYPHAQICVTDPSYFQDSNEGIVKIDNLFLTDTEQFFEPSKTYDLISRTKFSIPTISSIYRKEAIIKYGKFKYELSQWCDWYLSHKIGFLEPIVYIPENLGSMRLSENSFSAKKRNDKEAQKILFENLLKTLTSEKNETLLKFNKSGILTHLGLSFFWFILFRPRYSTFLYPYFKKKIKNIFFKIKRYFFLKRFRLPTLF